MTAAARYTHRVQMRFSDVDSMGHVNNARCVTYLEDARIGLLAELLAGAAAKTAPGLILARTEIDYRRPLLLSPEAVEVDVWVVRIGSKSFDLAYEVRQFGRCAASARTVMVAFDYASQSTRTLTTAEREGLSEWLVGEAAAASTESS